MFALLIKINLAASERTEKTHMTSPTCKVFQLTFKHIGCVFVWCTGATCSKSDPHPTPHTRHHQPLVKLQQYTKSPPHTGIHTIFIPQFNAELRLSFSLHLPSPRFCVCCWTETYRQEELLARPSPLPPVSSKKMRCLQHRNRRKPWAWSLWWRG